MYVVLVELEYLFQLAYCMDPADAMLVVGEIAFQSVGHQMERIAVLAHILEQHLT
ncbi:hypothetical protein SDC9_178808 [bioreactor metagenome]|uniref:Uncharacterized protein n=1 Tax=bioreactor metagenome TaxID=1076179 RepID=A0A645H4Q9_9ZZZZ